jgi:hypothetical protein
MAEQQAAPSTTGEITNAVLGLIANPPILAGVVLALIILVGWTIASKDRTEHLCSLIRALRDAWDRSDRSGRRRR